MKTMLELLIRLHEMRCCCEPMRSRAQLANGKKATACWHKLIVRECLPAAVLAHYDLMKKAERTLLSCPEVLAMAVLVSTYRSLSPHQRKQLVGHFAAPLAARSNAVQRSGTAKNVRRTTRRSKAITGDVASKQRPG